MTSKAFVRNQLHVPHLGIFLLLIALPSGYVFGVPVKPVLLGIAVSYVVLTAPAIRVSLSVVALSWALLSFFVLYAALGSLTWGSLAWRELQMVLSPFVIAALILLWLTAGDPYKRFGALLFAVLSVLGLTKFVMLLVGYEAASEGFRHIFGVGFVSMAIPYGLFRINLPTDILAAFAPAMLGWLALKQRIPGGGTAVWLFLGISFFIVLISFSRTLWVLFGFSMFFFFLFLGAGIRSWLFLIILATLSLLVGWEFVSTRFSPETIGVSDEIRHEQASALTDLWLRAPFFGHGLGAYNAALIRSAQEPYSYELQLLSFLPKLGVVGLFFLMIPASLGLLFLVMTRNFLALSLVSLLLLVSAFNPYMLNSSMALFYAFIGIVMKTQMSRTA